MCRAPLGLELLQQRQFLSRHGGRFGPSMAGKLLECVLYAVGGQHELSFHHRSDFDWGNPAGPPYMACELWVNVLWEELRWAVGHFISFDSIKLEEMVLFRKYLLEYWRAEELVTKSVRAALPTDVVKQKDVPEGVTPLGWSLLQKTQLTGNVREPATELGGKEWTAPEVGVMCRLVDSFSERLRWMGLTQERYDAVVEAGQREGHSIEKSRKGRGTRKGAGNGKRKGKDSEVHGEGQGKRSKETPRRRGPQSECGLPMRGSARTRAAPSLT